MNRKSLNYKSRSHIQDNHLQYIVVLSFLVLVSMLACVSDAPVLKPFWLVAIFLLILFGVWRDFRHRRSLCELRSTLHILQTLFDTSFHNETVEDALKEIGYAVNADFVYFLIQKNDTDSKCYEYRRDKQVKLSLTFEEQISLFCFAMQHEKRGKGYWTKKDSKNLNGPVAEIIEKHEIHNIECARVESSEHNMFGILFAINVERRLKKYYFECITRLLLASVIRFSHIEMLENISKFDSLTGLLNRSSYQTMVTGYKNASVQQLVCIYIDLNSLHNINNQFGHDKGDQILCCTANSLINNFGSNNVFRIGGDEFVVLYKYESKTNIEERIRHMRQELLDSGCNISIGIEWCDNSADIDIAIKRAEKKMFEEKNLYYKTEKRI